MIEYRPIVTPYGLRRVALTEPDAQRLDEQWGARAALPQEGTASAALIELIVDWALYTLAIAVCFMRDDYKRRECRLTLKLAARAFRAAYKKGER